MTGDSVQRELASVVRDYPFAYLATVSGGQRAHLVAVRPVLVGGVVHVPAPGRTSSRNVEEHRTVTLVWPPAEVDGYSLIMDGTGVLAGDELVVTPTRAVLHRPSPAAVSSRPGTAGPFEPDACGSDCIELTVPAPAGR